MESLHLTPRERDVVKAIRNLTDVNGKPPTLTELGESVGLRSTKTVRGHLERLSEKKVVKPRRRYAVRGIVLTRLGSAFLAARRNGVNKLAA